MAWENRIVGYGEVELDQLLANPLNFRIHPARQQEAMEGVLDDIGIIAPVIVNRRTGLMVDGHLRIGLGMRKGQRTFPVAFVDLSEAEEAEALATFDAIGAAAALDAGKLAELLAEVETDNSLVNNLLADLAAEAGVPRADADAEAEQTDKGEQGTAHKITIICSTEALEDFSETLRDWGLRDDVAITIA